MGRTRKSPLDRKADILAAAVELAKTSGFTKVTRDAVAIAAGVSTGLVSHYYNTMPQLKRDLMRYAVRYDVAEVIAQGLSIRDPHAMKASPEQKQKALMTLAE